MVHCCSELLDRKKVSRRKERRKTNKWARKKCQRFKLNIKAHKSPYTCDQHQNTNLKDITGGHSIREKPNLWNSEKIFMGPTLEGLNPCSCDVANNSVRKTIPYGNGSMDEAPVQAASSGNWQGKSMVWHRCTWASCTTPYVWRWKQGWQVHWAVAGLHFKQNFIQHQSVINRLIKEILSSWSSSHYQSIYQLLTNRLPFRSFTLNVTLLQSNRCIQQKCNY